MIQHGVNMTASDMKNMLESTSRTAGGEKTWEKLFANSAMNYQNQNDALLSAYGDTIAQAYKSNLEQRASIYDLGLSNTDTKDLQKFTHQDLLDTYNTYLSNYNEAKSNLMSNYTQEKGLYDEALASESENYANLFNYMNDYYLNILSGATRDVLTDTPIYEGKGKNAKIIGYQTETKSLKDEYGLDWLYDAEGKPFSKDQLMNILYDENRQLTNEGRIYYDMIFNNAFADTYKDVNGNPVVSFDEWLSTNDNTLYNWYHEPDPFNYTKLGTKIGTAKNLVRLSSTDEKFVQYQQVDATKRYLESATNSTLEKLNEDTKLSKNISALNNMYFDEAIDTSYTTSNRANAQGIAHQKQLRGQYVRELKSAADKAQSYITSASEHISDIYKDISEKLMSAIDEDILSEYENELNALVDKYSKLSIKLPDAYDVKTTEEFKKIRDYIKNAYDSVSVEFSSFNKELQNIIDKIYTKQNQRNYSATD